jgi:hypothetical protein
MGLRYLIHVTLGEKSGLIILLDILQGFVSRPLVNCKVMEPPFMSAQGSRHGYAQPTSLQGVAR